MSTMPSDQQKDPQLWKAAKQRASFKYHIGAFLTMTIFFWITWYLSGKHMSRSWPWPVWPMVIWGIILLFHFLRTYVYQQNNTAEKEYEKLKRQGDKQL
jgi:hypothetical protein